MAAPMPTQRNSVSRPTSSGSTTMAPVARIQASPHGMTTFHPKLISRS
jgi:hypothetical protein